MNINYYYLIFKFINVEQLYTLKGEPKLQKYR